MYTLVLPSYRCFMLNLALIGQAVSEDKMFEVYGNIHVYRPGMGPIFFRIINIQSYCPFPARFYL